MPVFYTPIPQNLRLGLAYASGSLFGNNRTGDSQGQDYNAVFMLELKFDLLPRYYQCLLVAGMVLLTIFEGLRLYLGYVGNLKEKVPELAGFWLLTFLFQLPILLFFLTDEGIVILPLERAVHSVYLLFVLSEVLAAFLALRAMSRKLTLQFHLRQFVQMESLQPAFMTPVFGLPSGRSVLPQPPGKDIEV
ncbi:hypothetical protein AAFF_G00422950 [Aldrovandia affinis]|uniref:Transmembrane protein 17B n=1 Tax=Aldrovandia affinis TaxID=143900 RepID=A0AAD7T6L2_9TELE|nr:hypothetical protein AAFF_G00422950 [Aldrovandia affinis]